MNNVYNVYEQALNSAKESLELLEPGSSPQVRTDTMDHGPAVSQCLPSVGGGSGSDELCDWLRVTRIYWWLILHNTIQRYQSLDYTQAEFYAVKRKPKFDEYGQMKQRSDNFDLIYREQNKWKWEY